MRSFLSLLLVLLLVPGWTGPDRLPLLHPDLTVRTSRWTPRGGWPARIGALEPVGALRLTSRDPAFGGFSALVLRDGAATLLSDGGNYVSLAIRGTALRRIAAGSLPAGPDTGWAKESRDSESLAVDPATGALWVGFERANAIWRYDPGFARARARRRLPGSRRWQDNGGAESLARLPDGRFVVIAERRAAGSGAGIDRPALLFDGDPASPRMSAARLRYVPPAGYDPSDAAALPDGDLLVLNRRFENLRFTSRLVLVAARTIRRGATLRGRVIATLPPGVLGENAEGIAITRERGRTMVWIVTDNDQWPIRPTILAKFRLRIAAAP